MKDCFGALQRRRCSQSSEMAFLCFFSQHVNLPFCPLCGEVISKRLAADQPHWSPVHSSPHLLALMRGAVTSRIMTSPRPTAAAANENRQFATDVEAIYQRCEKASRLSETQVHDEQHQIHTVSRSRDRVQFQNIPLNYAAFCFSVQLVFLYQQIQSKDKQVQLSQSKRATLDPVVRII